MLGLVALYAISMAWGLHLVLWFRIYVLPKVQGLRSAETSQRSTCLQKTGSLALGS